MLQEPGESPYDLHFNFFGFPVRITWTFWILAAVIGWNWSRAIDEGAALAQADTPGPFVLLMIWAVGLLVSILIHEMGHALAYRYYGMSSRIVLYHFGGLAISDGFGRWDGARRAQRIGPREQIIISAAGPAIQLLLALIVWLIGMQLGVRMEINEFINWLFGSDIGTNKFPGSAAVYAIFDAILYPSTVWAILNLAPILPLDGGRILQSVLVMTNNDQPLRTSYFISLATAGLLGFWCLTTGRPGGILFLFLAFSNWQSMQSGFDRY